MIQKRDEKSSDMTGFRQSPSSGSLMTADSRLSRMMVARPQSGADGFSVVGWVNFGSWLDVKTFIEGWLGPRFQRSANDTPAGGVAYWT